MSEATLPLPLEALSVAPATAPAVVASQAKTPETAPAAGVFAALLVRELSSEDGQLQESGSAVVSVPPVIQDEAVLPLPDGKGLPPEGGMFVPQVQLPGSVLADDGDILAHDRLPKELPVGSQQESKLPVFGGLARTVLGSPTSATGEASNPPMTPGEKVSATELPELAAKTPPEMDAGDEALPKVSLKDAAQVSINKEPPESPLMVGSRPIHHPNAEASERTTAMFPRFELPEPMRTQQWNQSLGNRIVWMANGHVQKAEMLLNPPELGPLEIRVSVSQDETRVFFTAQHAAVREAVDAALPRLRELMGTAGLNLVQVDVSQQGLEKDSQASGSDGAPDEFGETVSNDSDAAEAPVNAAIFQRHEGLIDDYA